MEEERVVERCWTPKIGTEGEGRYKYTVTSFKVFQLDINPVVSIGVENIEESKHECSDSTLDGLVS